MDTILCLAVFMHAFCHTDVENPLKGPDYEEQILYSVCENHLLKIMKEISVEILERRAC